VTADVLCRYLRARGLAVTFVRNFTDIDDKIIRRAAEVGTPAAELAGREIRAFGEDVAWLRCLPPTHEPRATAHIPAMLALIERLIGAGFAYPVADGSVYFRVRRFASYGKLSHRRLDDMETGEEIDAAKESPHDFALWKGAKPGEPSWPSPWGAGRPGACSGRSAAAALPRHALPYTARLLGDTARRVRPRPRTVIRGAGAGRRGGGRRTARDRPRRRARRPRHGLPRRVLRGDGQR